MEIRFSPDLHDLLFQSPSAKTGVKILEVLKDEAHYMIAVLHEDVSIYEFASADHKRSITASNTVKNYLNKDDVTEDVLHFFRLSKDTNKALMGISPNGTLSCYIQGYVEEKDQRSIFRIGKWDKSLSCMDVINYDGAVSSYDEISRFLTRKRHVEHKDILKFKAHMKMTHIK